MGGSVECDYERDDDGRPLANAEPPGPKWLRNRLGIDYFEDVVDVSLNGPVRDKTPLRRLTHLRRLVLNDTQVSDVSLFAGLTRLKKLRLEDTPVSKAAVKQLQSALPQCQIVQ